MPLWAVTVVLLVAGCNKLFDLEPVRSNSDAGGSGDGNVDSAIDAASTDAADCPVPPAYDEDSDGVDDRCDACPSMSGNNAVDGDKDGLPDACDPDSSAADKILFAAMFAVQSDADAFQLTNATWGAAGKGTIRMPTSATMRTALAYDAKRIEVRLNNIVTADGASTFAVANGTTITCTMVANDCAGSGTSSTCIKLSPTMNSPAAVGAAMSNIQRMEVTSKSSGTSCLATGSTSGGATTTSATMFTTDQFVLTTNAGTSLDVRSIVIYGAK